MRNNNVARLRAAKPGHSHRDDGLTELGHAGLRELLGTIGPRTHRAQPLGRRLWLGAVVLIAAFIIVTARDMRGDHHALPSHAPTAPHGIHTHTR
jgi:hypothetical protein